MPADSDAILASANAYYQQGKLREADVLLSKLHAKHPNNPRCLSLLLNVAMASENWSKALELITQLASVVDPTPGLTLYRALILAELNRPGEAEEELGQLTYPSLAKDLHPLWYHVLINKLGQIDVGMRLAEANFDGLAETPLKILLNAAVKNHHDDFARRCGRRLISIGADDSAVRRVLYVLEVRAGDAEAARTHLSTFAEAQHKPINQAIERNLAELDQTAFAFVHIPKTGGTSVKQAIEQSGINLSHRALCSQKQGLPIGYYDHYSPNFVGIDALKGKPIVINIRNIYSFLVSYYFDAKRIFFFDFLIEDSIAANKFDFPDFVKYLSEKTGRWVSRDLIFFPCFAQPSGDLAVDWVNRLETLESDLNCFTESLGIKLNVQLGHLNRGTADDHRRHYSDDTVDLVEQTWANDIRLFGFRFDGSYAEDALFHRDVTKWKGQISYSLSDKKLLMGTS